VLVKSLPAEEWRRFGPKIIRDEIGRLTRSIGEGRGAAVLAGFARGCLRIPGYTISRWRRVAIR
jgi:hypothetical protein